LDNTNESWKGWEGETLVLHGGAEENQLFGRNFAYKNVFINNYGGKCGDFPRVCVYKVDGVNLFGKVV